MKTTKLTKTGLILLGIGIVSIAIQFAYTSFYGETTADGVVNDTIFIPLGAFALVGAALLLLIAGIRSRLLKQPPQA